MAARVGCSSIWLQRLKSASHCVLLRVQSRGLLTPALWCLPLGMQKGSSGSFTRRSEHSLFSQMHETGRKRVGVTLTASQARCLLRVENRESLITYSHWESDFPLYWLVCVLGWEPESPIRMGRNSEAESTVFYQRDSIGNLRWKPPKNSLFKLLFSQILMSISGWNNANMYC